MLPRQHIPTLALTLLAMVAFAGNSLLCRVALKHTDIDAGSFTSIRLISGALTLQLILRMRSGSRPTLGSWRSALALFIYAATFSYAYVSLPAATGALLLFSAVQATMIGYGLWTGERLRWWQTVGLLCAASGLAGLLLPGVSAPPFAGSLLMFSAGLAWGVYSLRGKGAQDPLGTTAGNFARAVPFTLVLSVGALRWTSLDTAGVWYAISSGALASGIGYAVWYAALRGLKATSAATVQLSVPVIAAIGGVFFLGEAIGLRFVFASVAILGGIALVLMERRTSAG